MMKILLGLNANEILVLDIVLIAGTILLPGLWKLAAFGIVVGIASYKQIRYLMNCQKDR